MGDQQASSVLECLRRLESLQFYIDSYKENRGDELIASNKPFAGKEPFLLAVFKNFCKDCFVYDSDVHSTIDQDRDLPLMIELMVTYVHYMLDKNERDKLLLDLNEYGDLSSFFSNQIIDVPKPYGSIVMPERVKTLQYAKISPLILTMHEQRKREDRTKVAQIDLLK